MTYLSEAVRDAKRRGITGAQRRIIVNSADRIDYYIRNAKKRK